MPLYRQGEAQCTYTKVDDKFQNYTNGRQIGSLPSQDNGGSSKEERTSKTGFYNSFLSDPQKSAPKVGI